MSKDVSEPVRLSIRSRIWAKADELGWSKLSDLDRAAWYVNWTKDPEIGGALAKFMDPRRVRVYIKDAMMKPYRRARLEEDMHRVFASAGVEISANVIATFEKPPGRIVADHKVICWGSSRDWKDVVFSVFERAYTNGAIPHAAVLLESGRTLDETTRSLVREAATRLQVRHIHWID